MMALAWFPKKALIWLVLDWHVTDATEVHDILSQIQSVVAL